MAMTLLNRSHRTTSEPDDFTSPRLGRLIAVDAVGRPLVSFDDAPAPSVVARVATADAAPSDAEVREQPAVVLMFQDGDPSLPIIVGIVRPRFGAAMSTPVAPTNQAAGTVEVNGKSLIFDAQDELVFRCGLGSLTIRANGHIVVKGTRVVSRASETNRIRGASVQIN